MHLLLEVEDSEGDMPQRTFCARHHTTSGVRRYVSGVLHCLQQCLQSCHDIRGSRRGVGGSWLQLLGIDYTQIHSPCCPCQACLNNLQSTSEEGYDMIACKQSSSETEDIHIKHQMRQTSHLEPACCSVSSQTGRWQLHLGWQQQKAGKATAWRLQLLLRPAGDCNARKERLQSIENMLLSTMHQMPYATEELHLAVPDCSGESSWSSRCASCISSQVALRRAKCSGSLVCMKSSALQFWLRWQLTMEYREIKA